MMLVEALRDDGYQPEEAANFAQAMEKLKSTGDQLSGAVIDLGLPDLPGEELVSAIRATKPDMPIILMTGFTDDHVVKRFSSTARIQILMKPFDPYILVDALRRLGI
jgi:DNA-binding response OmpR family regulator